MPDQHSNKTCHMPYFTGPIKTRAANCDPRIGDRPTTECWARLSQRSAPPHLLRKPARTLGVGMVRPERALQLRERLCRSVARLIGLPLGREGARL
jgi:hypothetical protein